MSEITSGRPSLIARGRFRHWSVRGVEVRAIALELLEWRLGTRRFEGKGPTAYERQKKTNDEAVGGNG